MTDTEKTKNNAGAKKKAAAPKRKTAKKTRHFADYIVIFAIIAVIIYTAAAIALQFMGFYEISSTLTTCWFAFWTTELVSLATIKNVKTKRENADKSENKTDDNVKG